MTQIENLSVPELQAEIEHLREELQMREQLIQQLSQELFRLVKGNSPVLTEASTPQSEEIKVLRHQLQEVEKQALFYQEQIAERDTEIYQLRHSVQELGDRSRMLEQVVEEMPHVYREKFEQRLIPIRDKVALIQQENRRLHAELQSVSYRLAVRNRRITHIDLPNFPRINSEAAPVPSVG